MNDTFRRLFGPDEPEERKPVEPETDPSYRRKARLAGMNTFPSLAPRTPHVYGTEPLNNIGERVGWFDIHGTTVNINDTTLHVIEPDEIYDRPTLKKLVPYHEPLKDALEKVIFGAALEDHFHGETRIYLANRTDFKVPALSALTLKDNTDLFYAICIPILGKKERAVYQIRAKMDGEEGPQIEGTGVIMKKEDGTKVIEEINEFLDSRFGF